jgi:hypothetical protein
MGTGVGAEDLLVRAMNVRKAIFNREHEDIVDALEIIALAYSN